MKVLICSIVRNRRKHLDNYKKQIEELVRLNPDIEFQLSIFENDSDDHSDTFLKEAKWPIPALIKCDKLQTEYFGSFKHQKRVQNLAEARNKALLQSPFFAQADKILFIEPDVRFNPADIRKLLDSDADIISGISLGGNGNPNTLYDGWATRRTESAKDWTGEKPEGVIKLWSTFNCVCCYSGDMLRDNIMFGWWNDRFSCPECDTVVICERAHSLGYNEIYLNAEVRVMHE